MGFAPYMSTKVRIRYQKPHQLDLRPASLWRYNGYVTQELTEWLVIMKILELRPARRLLGTALLLLTGLSASADEIYRWVDENGVVNYTQQKPRGTEVETIVTKGGSARVARNTPTPAAAPAPVTSAATGERLSPEQEKMLEGLRAAEQTRQNEIAKIKEQNCQQSRDVLSRLSVKNRIRVKGEDGDYTVMPEDERQDRISKAQENIARFCVS